MVSKPIIDITVDWCLRYGKTPTISDDRYTFVDNLFKNSSLLSITFHTLNLVDQSVNFVFLSNVVQYTNMGDEKKKETKIEKKDEFGNTVEETEIEEKEED